MVKDIFIVYKNNVAICNKKVDGKYKNYVKLKFSYVKENKTKELNDFKNEKREYSIGDLEKIKQISGIYENSKELREHIKKLPKYSFAIWFKFKLKAPYFSKDDDEFYIIQNPILKETNFKVPMIRGSGWKGALAHAFRELFKKDSENNREKIESFLRIFGAGSENIKVIESYVLGKSKNVEEAKNKLLEFMLFELGLEVSKKIIDEVNKCNNLECIKNILKNRLSKKYQDSQQNLPLEFRTHKGRTIFYPTYFDRLSLEIINPHDRIKRAGTNPIHYEVVPQNTDGIFQLIYIPFDGIVKGEKELKNEVKQDLRFLTEVIEKLRDMGLGAKTKLGWGRFEIIKDASNKELKKVICNGNDIDIPRG